MINRSLPWVKNGGSAAAAAAMSRSHDDSPINKVIVVFIIVFNRLVNGEEPHPRDVYDIEGIILCASWAVGTPSH
jgi:hypothetical protein